MLKNRREPGWRSRFGHQFPDAHLSAPSPTVTPHHPPNLSSLHATSEAPSCERNRTPGLLTARLFSESQQLPLTALPLPAPTSGRCFKALGLLALSPRGLTLTPHSHAMFGGCPFPPPRPPLLLPASPAPAWLLPRPPGETGLPTGKISVMHKCPEADKCPSTGPACAAGLPFLLTSLLCPGWCEGVGGGHGVGAV